MLQLQVRDEHEPKWSLRPDACVANGTFEWRFENKHAKINGTIHTSCEQCLHHTRNFSEIKLTLKRRDNMPHAMHASGPKGPLQVVLKILVDYRCINVYIYYKLSVRTYRVRTYRWSVGGARFCSLLACK